jgi:HAD superfamily hydrolase (TIGR01509 family)
VPIELVIFDCDGVLVDSEPLVNRVYLEMLAEEGFSLDEAATLREFAGAAMATRIETLASRLRWEPPAGFERGFLARLAQRVPVELRPVDGVRDLLARLDLPRCVASNGTHDEIRLRLDATDLRAAFGEHLFSAEDVARPKPAPDVYLFAAKKMKVRAERCVVIEDSVPGVRAAVAAGMSVLGRAALTDPKALADEGARTFRSFVEVDALLATMR